MMKTGLRWILLCCGVLAVLPVRTNSKPYYANVGLMSFLLLFSALYCLQSISEFSSFYHSTIRLAIDRFQVLLNTLATFYSMFAAFSMRGRVQNILLELRALDALLTKNHISVRYPFRVYLLTACSRYALISVGGVMVYVVSPARDPLTLSMFYITIILPLCVSNAAQCFFCCLLDTVRQRLRSITGIHHVVVYSRLVDSASQLNGLYSLQHLFLVSSIFVLITANTNSVIDSVTAWVVDPQTSKLSIATLSYAYFAIFRILELAVLIHHCEAFVSQCNEFNSSLYEAMIKQNSHMDGKEKLSLHLTIQKEAVFSVSGFFNLDFTLLHSILAAMTTYLVILIQFSQPLSNTGALANSTANFSSES